MQSPIADEIVTLVDQIITVQGQISEQFPQIFENIVKENLAKNITSSLNNIYQTQSLALQNLREIEDLETKIIYFRILYDTNLPMPKDKYVYPVPPQEENEIVSAQTQNDEIDDIDPIQHYRIISIHPLYGTLGNLQTLNSTMLQKAFLEMKDKRNLTLDNEARQKGANCSEFTYQAGNRHKRFATTLLSLAFDGFKTYISHKADKKLIKGMKIIRKNQKIMNKRITSGK